LRKLLSLSAILFLFTLTSLFARDVEIIVEDSELGMSLEGAIIRLPDGSQYVCGKNGRITISVPDDRQIIIHITYPGYENGRLRILNDKDKYTLGLKLSGVMESRELVIEASKPGSGETATGRSKAISGREITQSAEIGLVEDVMGSVKLLPGVGYTGFFDARPSIRGGDPGDMAASLDGYYIFNPYFWGGGFSIFDPRMVESAQLSHGVFTTRYGHSISGLLDITSRKPSPVETEFEVGVNTSAASFNISVPINGKGGILFMGRVTYYDPFVETAKAMSKVIKDLEVINSVRVAPYIRSGIVTGNYRFYDNLELKATGFWGMDGIGLTMEEDPVVKPELTSSSKTVFDWTNYQGFFTTGLSWNPRNNKLFKFTAGTGFEQAIVGGVQRFNVLEKYYSQQFKNNYGAILSGFPGFDPTKPYQMSETSVFNEDTNHISAQGRVDYDWELGRGFLLAIGVQEMYTRMIYKADQRGLMAQRIDSLDSRTKQILLDDMGITDPALVEFIEKNGYAGLSLTFPINAANNYFINSAYTLLEYKTPGNRFGAELGLRLDHYLVSNNEVSIQSKPVLNPRLNLDFNVFKDGNFFKSLDLAAGTGLFSSMDDYAMLMEKKYGIKEMKPARSWTSILGTKIEMPFGLSFNIETYYKFIFNRMYIPVETRIDTFEIKPQFNGEGRAFGFDLMLQKKQSRFWDGWISYSWNWVKFRDPDGGNSLIGIGGGDQGNDWYYPDFHRFHNLNLVLNIKPTPRINIYTRFGFASGVVLEKLIGEGPISYPVWLYDPVNGSKLIEQYYWPSGRDQNNRTTPSLPLDMKLSIFGNNRNGKVNYEVYFGLENMLILLYSAKGNPGFDPYTGEKNDGNSADNNVGLPIPIPSFGVKICY